MDLLTYYHSTYFSFSDWLKSQRMQVLILIFIFYVCRPLKGVIVPVVRSEDRGNWDKHLGVTKAMQGRLMRKIQSFSRTCRSTNSIPWKSRLFWNKWILQWLKKRKRKKNMVRLCKLSLYANESCDDHAVYFRRWLKWRAMLIQLLITFRRKRFFTVNKKEHKNLIAKKSCFV